MGYFVFLVGLFVVALFFLKGVRADISGLLVQNAEINPAVAEIGEHVSVKMKIRNIQRNDKCCNVTLFCGDCVVETKKVNIAHQSSVPMCFELNTSLMSTGVYSIEVLIEEPSGQQKIFDLGSIPIEEANATAPDVTDPEPLPMVHELLKLPNCLVVPHIGSGSIATRTKMAEIAAENLMAGLKGERPKFIVNPEVLTDD